LEIILGKGISTISFGINQLELIAQLGKPDKIVFNSEEDQEEQNDPDPVFQYNSLKSRFTFFNDSNGRLGYIRSTNPDLTFKGQKIIGQKIDIVKRDVFSILDKKWEIEEYFTFSAHFNEPNWLTISEEYDLVTQIELGVLFKENSDEFDWPMT
jgi:hypothetical protein